MTADGSTSPAALLRDADNAMYEAKRSGRDQVVLFHSNAPRDGESQVGADPRPRPAPQRRLSSRR